MLATIEATSDYAARQTHAAHAYRQLNGLTISTLGIGTYLGRDTLEEDERLREALTRCLTQGVNLIDTAVNYRAQRAERVIGEVLSGLPRLGLSRGEVVVCTKAGYLPFDGTVPQDREAFVRRTYLDSGIVPPGALVAGCHCIAPGYLRDQIARSLRNLRSPGVDLFYLHNPEEQLAEVDRAEFERRMLGAFALCEELCDRGQIGRYGCATWDGLRVAEGAPNHLSLFRLCELARQVGGQDHHFRAVQLPLSLALTEALFDKNQRLGDRQVTLLEAAGELGVAVVCSGPLAQGKVLSRPLPERLRKPMANLTRDSQRALQFVRSAPLVTAVLCGMKGRAHVDENLQVLEVAPMRPDHFARSFPSG